MKFVVLEIYIDNDENNKDKAFVLPAHDTDDQNQAESIYHSILSFAAVSTHKSHGAIILYDGTNVLKQYTYVHPNMPDGEEN